MSKDELLEILKKNIPEDFRDDADDFADYILAVGKDELNTIIEIVLDGFGRQEYFDEMDTERITIRYYAAAQGPRLNSVRCPNPARAVFLHGCKKWKTHLQY